MKNKEEIIKQISLLEERINSYLQLVNIDDVATSIIMSYLFARNRLQWVISDELFIVNDDYHDKILDILIRGK